MNRPYRAAIFVTSLLALLNGVALWYGQRLDPSFQQDPIYPDYIRTRSLLLRPGSIAVIAAALGIWVALVYWRSRKHEISKTQKFIVTCMILASFYGYLLTALFRL